MLLKDNDRFRAARNHLGMATKGTKKGDVARAALITLGMQEKKMPNEQAVALYCHKFRLDEAFLAESTRPQIARKRKALPPEAFYASKEWRQLRYRVLRDRGSACECCGVTPKQGRSVHVDHIKPRSLFPKLELEYTNLQILCEDCNSGKSNLHYTDWR